MTYHVSGSLQSVLFPFGFHSQMHASILPHINLIEPWLRTIPCYHPLDKRVTLQCHCC